MAKSKNIPRIEKDTTRIVVPHEGGEITFSYSDQRLQDYRAAGKGIIARELNVPSGDCTASLFHSVYGSDVQNESELEKIRNIMRNSLGWVFNNQLWTPEGLYVVIDTKAEGLSRKLNPILLEKRLEGAKEISWGGIRISKDNSVRFAPVGSYSLGRQEDLSNQGDVISNYGVEGSKNLAEIAESKHFKIKPRTWGVKVSESGEPVQRVSSLGAFVDEALNVGGGDWYADSGYAFGVLD